MLPCFGLDISFCRFKLSPFIALFFSVLAKTEPNLQTLLERNEREVKELIMGSINEKHERTSGFQS